MLRIVWYLLRSNGSFRIASACASVSAAGVPLKLEDLSPLLPLFAVGAGLAKRSPDEPAALAGPSAAADFVLAPLLFARVGVDIGGIDLRIVRRRDG